ncbi:MAG: DNA repair protein RadC [Bacteroidota bacterium]
MNTCIEAPHLRIQDWATADRPREKLMQKGSAVLTEAELIGILIGSGTQKLSAVNLAQLILKHYDNDLNLLAKCSVKELQRFKGIGEAKAITIASAMELSRRRKDQNIAPRPRLHDSSSVYHLIQPELADKPIEEFWVILINKANYLIKKQFISSGGVDATLADPKLVFRAALDHQAAGIILVHNHPSGNPEPSDKDITLTKKLIEGGKFLDITVLDHIIVAGSSYFSFADDRLLFKPTPIIAMQG